MKGGGLAPKGAFGGSGPPGSEGWLGDNGKGDQVIAFEEGTDYLFFQVARARCEVGHGGVTACYQRGVGGWWGRGGERGCGDRAAPRFGLGSLLLMVVCMRWHNQAIHRGEAPCGMSLPCMRAALPVFNPPEHLSLPSRPVLPISHPAFTPAD